MPHDDPQQGGDGRVHNRYVLIMDEIRNLAPLELAKMIWSLRQQAMPAPIDPDSQRFQALVAAAADDADRNFGTDATMVPARLVGLSWLGMFATALLQSIPSRAEARLGDAARWRVFRRLFGNYPPGSELVFRRDMDGDKPVHLIARRDDMPGRELRWNEDGNATVDDALDHILVAAQREFEAKVPDPAGEKFAFGLAAKTTKPVVEVVAAVWVYAGQFWVCRRTDDGAHGGLAGMWEYPGGKMERGESLIEAMKREMREEFNAGVNVTHELAVIESEAWGKVYRVHFLRVQFLEAPRLRVHDLAAWMTPDELVTVQHLPSGTEFNRRLLAGEIVLEHQPPTAFERATFAREAATP